MQGFTARLERQMIFRFRVVAAVFFLLFAGMVAAGWMAGKRAADRWYAKNWRRTQQDGRIQLNNNANVVDNLNRLAFDTGTTGAVILDSNGGAHFNVTSSELPGIGETFPAVSITRRDGTAYWKCPVGWNLMHLHIDGRKDLTLYRCVLPGWGE